MSEIPLLRRWKVPAPGLPRVPLLPCVLALLWATGCHGGSRTATQLPDAPAAESQAQPVASDGGTGHEAPDRSSPVRLVAFGDIHGDLDALRRALRLAGAIDGEDRWSGGELVVVHTGDSIDRGDDDREVLELLHRLASEARAAGGACLAVLGNHELMNADGDGRYVSEASRAGYAGLEGLDLQDEAIRALPAAERAHAAAFAPGGPMAAILAERQVVAQVGDSLFVHGGVLPQNVEYGLERIDEETKAWLLGTAGKRPGWVKGDDSPVWSRHYSDEPDEVDCALLARVLDATGTRRMVVGHTIQKTGISSACDEGVWRIDTGMSRHYGGEVQVLEIVGDSVRVLREPSGAVGGAGG